MRYLNTVYVRSHRAKVGVRRGTLVVTNPDGVQRIPLETVDAVVMLGAAQITSQAMDACVQRSVRLAALRRSGAVRFVVCGPTGGNVHLRMALYAAVADHARSLELSRTIVAAKLQNSRHVIDRWARDTPKRSTARDLADRSTRIRERVARLASATTPDHIRGIEGDAARIHFRALSIVLADSDLAYGTRTRRPPRDPVNATLSFCYGLLVTEFVGAVESIGLDHQMGFFHRPRSGRPSLALDLVEELRALADRFVVTLIRRHQIRPSCFRRVPGGAVYLNDEGRNSVLQAWERHKNTDVPHTALRRRVGRWALPTVQATLLARHLRGDLPFYPPYVMV